MPLQNIKCGMLVVWTKVGKSWKCFIFGYSCAQNIPYQSEGPLAEKCLRIIRLPYLNIFNNHYYYYDYFYDIPFLTSQ